MPKTDLSEFYFLILVGISLNLMACSSFSTSPIISLYDFEDEKSFETIEFKCHSRFQLSEAYRRSGRSSLEMWFYPAETVGFILNCQKKIKKTDSLSIWAYNPTNESILLSIDVHSKGNRVFSDEFDLKTGENSIQFFFDKHFEKQNMQLKAITIYLKNNDSLKRLYFDDLVLNRKH